MPLVDHALAVEGRQHRSSETLGERRDLGCSIRRSATGDDHRSARRGQQLRRLSDGGGVARGRGGRGARDPIRLGDVCGGLEDIEGDLDVHGPRATGSEEREGIVHGFDGFGSRVHAARPLGDRADHGRGILRLVQRADVGELRAEGHAGRQHDHRPRLAERGADRAHGVLQTGAGGRDHDTGEPGLLRPAVGAVARALLVAVGHRADAELGERPVELEVVRAGDAEDRGHAIGADGLEHGAARGVGILLAVRHDVRHCTGAPRRPRSRAR